jgi:two-component system, cell cycle response regulator
MTAQILLIEDNEASLTLMRYLLQGSGYKPIVAKDGEEGIEVLGSCIPDLIVSDLEMPKVDGYQVCRHVKAHPELKKVPILAVTAFAMVGDRDRIMQAGFDGYLTKPLEPQNFVSQVEAFIRPERRSFKSDTPDYGPSESDFPETPTRETILVVDDSIVNRDLIVSTLVPFGYNVLVASEPKGARDQASKHLPSLVLTDFHMAPHNALDLLTWFRSDPRLRAIPVIVISASFGDATEGQRSLDLGAARTLNRPIEPDKLLAEIANVLKPGVTRV